MKENDLTWEDRHPIISSIVNSCLMVVSLFFVILVVALTVYVLITMQDERALLELLAERLGF